MALCYNTYRNEEGKPHKTRKGNNMMKKYETSKYVALFDRPYHALLKICQARNIYVDPSRKYSKTEIIMMIAMDGTHAECVPERHPYRITQYANTRFAKLSAPQLSLLHWLENRGFLHQCEIEKLNDIEYEEP